MKQYSTHPLYTEPEYLHPKYAGDRTIVVCPGFSFPTWFYKYLKKVSYFEERLFYYLFYLQGAQTRIVYLLSEEVDPVIIDYFFETAAIAMQVDQSVMRERLKVFSIDDPRNLSLPMKLLENADKMAQLKDALGDSEIAYLDCFGGTEYEVQLANALGIPLFGNMPEFFKYDEKSGGRLVAQETHRLLPKGVENLNSYDDVYQAWREQCNGGAKTYLLKVNNGDAGLGVVRVDCSTRPNSFDEFFQSIQFTKEMTSEVFGGLLEAFGGVFEEFIEAQIKHSPSVQYVVWPDGRYDLLSTHEQELKSDGHYLGCNFPCRSDYRNQLQDESEPLVKWLAQKGVRGRISIDYLAVRQSVDAPWEMYFIELNIRKSATTHNNQWAQYLTGARFDSNGGELHADHGQSIYYYSTEQAWLKPEVAALSVVDFLERVQDLGIAYDHSTQEGMFFHMLSTLNTQGRVGYTTIASRPERAEEYKRKFSHAFGKRA